MSMFPPDWVGEEGGWRFWAFLACGGLVQYGLATLTMSLQAHGRATRRLPHPVAVELLDHIDHLEWREGGAPHFVATETLGAITTTMAHLFVPVERQILIIPMRAFSDRNEMMVFGAELERRNAAFAAELEGPGAD